MTKAPNINIIDSQESLIATQNSEQTAFKVVLPQQSQTSNVTASASTPTVSSVPSMLGKNNLPAFLNKLYGMVGSPDTDDWVHWSESGESFIIPNHQALAEYVLGHHFKHSNFNSFVRQLNMYGFHKVPHLNHGILHNGGLPEVWEFANENFHRDDPARMRNIVRKKGEAEKARSAAKQQRLHSSDPQTGLMADPADIAIARAEIQTVAARQYLIREELCRLAESTDNLWKYAIDTRNKYREQQEKLDRIIQVLSETFRKRTSISELPSKVRGLLEGPSQQDEKKLDNTVAPTSVSIQEQAQLEVMKMIANGKIPVGFQEAIQQYLQNLDQGNVVSATPAAPTSRPSPDSPDVLTMYQAANNADQLAQVREWLNETEPNLAGLGVDSNPPAAGNVDYTDCLNDSHYTFDPFIANPNFDPSADVYGTDYVQPWMPQYVSIEHPQEIKSMGQKRAREEEADGLSAKRTRI